MAGPRDLGGLRVALATARSPLERAKLVARSWRTVRRLGPEQRRALAAALGFDGARELVERIAERGRLNPTALLRGLEHLRGRDPSELRELLRGLGDRRRRGELLRRGLDAAAERLDLPGLEAETGASPPREDETPGPVAPVGGAESAPSPPPAPPPPEHPVAAEPRTVVLPTPKERPVAAPPRSSERPEPPAPVAPRPEVRPRRAESPPTAVAAAPVAWVERIRAAAGPMQRLRIVRQGIAEAATLDETQLARLLDGIPEEWVRRRVLSALLAERIPADLEPALRLIGRLGSTASRRWCLAVLRHSRGLSEGEEQRLEHWAAQPRGRREA